MVSGILSLEPAHQAVDPGTFFSDYLSGDSTSMEKGLTDKLRTHHGDFPYNRYTYINIIPKKMKVWNLWEVPCPMFSFGGCMLQMTAVYL